MTKINELDKLLAQLSGELSGFLEIEVAFLFGPATSLMCRYGDKKVFVALCTASQEDVV